MLKKNKCFKKFLKNRSVLNKANFNKERNTYNRALQEKKQSYFRQTFKKLSNNLKETWKNINKQLGKVKSSVCSSISINNNLVNDSLQITNYFNDYFVNVANNLVSDLPQTSHSFQTFMQSPTLSTLYLYPTSLTEIKKLISNLQPKKSTGIDEIPPTILKSTPDNILIALTHVFNLSLAGGEFITDFKTAKVAPIHKKGSVTNVCNYRPISLLCSMSKILEKLIYNRVVLFLKKQNFFYKYQFGFRKNHSTSHATSLLIENIAEAFENKEHVLGIFLDLSKAFDTIDHKILLSKLWHCGIRGVAHDWFCSYLSNRKQLVEINNICSNIKSIKYGVPQGSILGPLLFSIYVNDLNNCLTLGKCIMYADDTNIFLKSNCYETLYEAANKELVNIDKWLLANRLFLNTDKTHYVIFRTPKTKPPSKKLTISIRNKFISQQPKTKFLGIIFHEHLSWKLHMDFVLRKICVSYGTIKKISKHFDKKTLLVLYNSLIISHIRYCITTWHIGNKTTASKIQRIANKFIRMTFGLHHRANVTDILRNNNIMTIDQITELEITCFMYKYIKGMLPPCFDHFFQNNLVSDNFTKCTRSQSKFYPSFCRLNITKQSLRYRGPLAWNKVPTSIKQIKSYSKFRTEFQKHLIAT